MNIELTKEERKFKAGLYQLDRAIRRISLSVGNKKLEWLRLRVGDRTLRVAIAKSGYNLHHFLGVGQPAGETVLEGEFKNAHAEIGAYMLKEFGLEDSKVAQDILNS